MGAGFVVFQLNAVTVYADQSVMMNIPLAPHALGATNVPEDVEVSGTLAVIVEDDFEHGRSSPIYELTLTGAGLDELDVSFVGDGAPDGLVSGDRVTYAWVAVGFNTTPPTDTTPPTAPANLTAKRKGLNVDLSWAASSDNVGVLGYDVYRNNAKSATTASIAYSDSTTTSGGGTYTYHVVAFDAAGNVSASSNTASIVR